MSGIQTGNLGQMLFIVPIFLRSRDYFGTTKCNMKNTQGELTVDLVIHEVDIPFNYTPPTAFPTVKGPTTAKVTTQKTTVKVPPTTTSKPKTDAVKDEQCGFIKGLGMDLYVFIALVMAGVALFLSVLCLLMLMILIRRQP